MIEHGILLGAWLVGKPAIGIEDALKWNIAVRSRSHSTLLEVVEMLPVVVPAALPIHGVSPG